MRRKQLSDQLREDLRSKRGHSATPGSEGIDPAVHDAETARQISEHTSETQREGKSGSDAVEVVEQVTADLADTDFELDPDRDRMVAVSFAQDATPTDDPLLLRDRADLLSSLAAQANDLADDLRDDPHQAPPTLARDLERYAREAKQDDPAKVRARRLESLIVGLKAGLADDNIRMGLGNYLLTKLEELVAQHNGLLASYFAEVSSIILAAKSHQLPAETTHQLLDENLALAGELIVSDAWRDALPKPPIDYPVQFEQQRAALRERAAPIDLKDEGVERDLLIQMTNAGYVTATATVSRLIGKTLRAAGNGH